VVIMPTLIKGVVLKKRESLMQILLITGKRFWTFRRDDLATREHVWIAWNYTISVATRVMSEHEHKQFLKNEDPEPDVFSDPDDEGYVDEDVLGADDESWPKQLDNKEAEPEARRFSYPLYGEFEEEFEEPKLEDREFEDWRFSNPESEGLD
jgi:hypothetical protein